MYSQKFNTKAFDSILIKKNEVLRLAGNYKALVSLNKEYLKQAKEKNYNEGEALCYINLANICGTIGNYKNEFHFLNAAEKKLGKTNNPHLKAKLYQEYGQVYFGVGLYKNALLYNSKSINYIKKVNNKDKKEYRLERSYANRADFLYRIKRPDSSLIYFHKALKEKDAPIIKALIAKHHLLYTKRLDSSFFYLQEAEKQLPTDTTLTVQKAVVYSVYGDYYSQIEKYKKALYFYQEALKVYKNTNRVYNIPGIYQSIADTYKKLNDPVNEYKNRELFETAKENLDTNLNEAINLSIDQLLSEKDKETNSYKSKLLVYTSELTVILIIFTLAVIVFLSYKKRKSLIKKKKQLNVETDILKNKLKNDYFEELVSLAKKNDSTFFVRFKEIYPEFINKLLQINPSLSNSELNFCAMIKLNFTSKEIANYTYVQHKSVQQKKYRIRKRLEISSDQDLFIFFNNLDQ